METVAFYSYKGGVGRTLLVANTAQFLALCGKKVVALDLDLEAPGLHEKLATHVTLQLATDGMLAGAVDLLHSIVADGAPSVQVKSCSVEISVPRSSSGSLTLIPAGSAPSVAYWKALNDLNQALRQSTSDSTLAEAVLELQSRIAEQFSPDYLLIDSRTGVTELGGFATSLLADRVVCLTTNSRESIKGTKVVAQALKDSPRLTSQRPLQVDFVVSRVDRRARDISKDLSDELGGKVTVLPHDAGLTQTERTFFTVGPSPELRYDEDYEPHLLPATLEWMATTFKAAKSAAELASKRMLAVHRVWQDLTRTWRRVRGGTSGREAWPIEQLAERVRFERKKKHREADIVAYDAPSNRPNRKEQLVVEYIDGEDIDEVAKWWLDNTDVPILVTLSERGTRKIFSLKRHYSGPKVVSTDRWDLPLPDDFKALTNPADASIESLLDAVKRGHEYHLDRIVEQWVHASSSTMHGGMPWRPSITKRILDTFAQVRDHDLAKRILWASSGHRLDFDDFKMDREGGGARELVQAGLFSPLLWRLPVQASLEILKEGTRRGMPFGQSSAQFALQMLASELLGLIYDPDKYFRIEGQQMLGRVPGTVEKNEDRRLYSLTRLFSSTELKFEASESWPDIELTAEREGSLAGHVSNHFLSLVSTRYLQPTGWLGNFDAKSGCVRLFMPAIHALADRTGVDRQHLASLVLLQETICGLAFLARDLDGRMSSMQPVSSALSALQGRTSAYSALIQFFTFKQLKELSDPGLMRAFEALSEVMSPPNRAWRRLQDMPLEDGRAWLVNIRRGVGGSPWAVYLLGSE